MITTQPLAAMQTNLWLVNLRPTVVAHTPLLAKDTTWLVNNQHPGNPGHILVKPCRVTPPTPTHPPPPGEQQCAYVVSLAVCLITGSIQLGAQRAGQVQVGREGEHAVAHLQNHHYKMQYGPYVCFNVQALLQAPSSWGVGNRTGLDWWGGGRALERKMPQKNTMLNVASGGDALQ
jgi:hypothetical protein